MKAKGEQQEEGSPSVKYLWYAGHANSFSHENRHVWV